MSDESEAIKEVAITAGKVTDAGREIGGFIAKLVCGPLEQGIGIFEDKLRYIRWERQLRLMKRVEKSMHEIGINQPTRFIPLKFAVPFFQGASLEDDDYLQDRWANLLVNAVNARSGIDLKRVYISILENIDSFEVKILEKIYSIPFEKTQHVGIRTRDLPEDIQVGNDDQSQNDIPPGPEVALALANLARLGCIKFRMTWGGGEVFSRVNPTLLGKYFVEACTLKNGKS